MKTRTNQPVFFDNGQKVDDSALGGTKLYKHFITLNDTYSQETYELTVINTSLSPITSFTSFGNIVSGNLRYGINDPTPGDVPFVILNYQEETEYGPGYIFEGHTLAIDNITFGTDSITPL